MFPHPSERTQSPQLLLPQTVAFEVYRSLGASHLEIGAAVHDSASEDMFPSSVNRSRVGTDPDSIENVFALAER